MFYFFVLCCMRVWNNILDKYYYPATSTRIDYILNQWMFALLTYLLYTEKIIMSQCN